MRRLWAAGTAVLVCLMLAGVPALAQSPSSAPFKEGVLVTGLPGGGCSGGTYTRDLESGVIIARNLGLTCIGKYSDPRLDGTWIVDGYYDACFSTTGVVYGPSSCMYWGTAKMTKPEGGWEGRVTCVDTVRNTVRGCIGIYTGTGAYDGMTYIEHEEYNQDTQADEVHGILYEGPPPPWTLP